MRSRIPASTWLLVLGMTLWSLSAPVRADDAEQALVGVDDGCDVQTHLAELRVSVPDWFDRLHRLYSQIEADIPSPFPVRPVPAITFRQRHVESAAVIPEAFFIAVDGDRWVGLAISRRYLEQRHTHPRPRYRDRQHDDADPEKGWGWIIAGGFCRG